MRRKRLRYSLENVAVTCNLLSFTSETKFNAIRCIAQRELIIFTSSNETPMKCRMENTFLLEISELAPFNYLIEIDKWK